MSGFFKQKNKTTELFGYVNDLIEVFTSTCIMRTILVLFGLIFSINCFAQFEGNQWTGKTYSVSGGWSIEQENDNYYLQLSEDFETSQGPDLKLFLTTKPILEIGNREAIEAHSTFIARLNSVTGAQRYPLPEGIDPNQFKGLAIHCEEFSVVWGGVDFNE